MPTNEHATLDGPHLIVQKRDCEGALIIDGWTGRVVQPIDERPDWSEGLVVAVLHERQRFYETRLGKAPALASPLYFEDLGWVAIDAAGDEIELEADSEYRMDKIAEATGVIRSADLSDTREDDVTGELAHVLTDGSESYTLEEAMALDAADEANFEAHAQNG